MIQMSNNTLLDVLDKSMEDVNMFLPISNVINYETTDVITNDSTLITISPEQYVREINKNYYNVENTYVVNPLKDTLEYLYGDRNIYLQNDYKGRLRDFYQQAYDNDVDKQNVAKLVFTPTDYTYPYKQFHYYDLANMDYAKAVDCLMSSEQQYNVSEINKYDYSCDKDCKSVYDVYKIPHDLLKMFTHITKYWNDIKDQLTLDKNTGYYCYVVKDGKKTISIPIICKHQAMILSNIPLQTISSQCYSNGVCKYCGQEIIAYNDGNDFVLPPSAMSLIISFADIFTHKQSIDTIIFDTNDFIVKRLQQLEVSPYSTDECVGYVCLFIIKLCQLGSKQFDISDAKLKKLLNKLSKQLSILGKSEQDIDELLNNTELFDGIDNLIGSFKNDGIKQTSDDNNQQHINIVDQIVFNGTNKTPKTQLQQYYLANNGKIYEMLLALRTLLNNVYNSKFNHVIKDVEHIVEYDDFIKNVNTFGYDFFRKTANVYCPVNYCHQWVNKQCKHCGLKQDMNNLDEIYNKFASVISNINVEEPMLITDTFQNTIDINNKTIINDIKQTDYKDFNEIVQQYVDYDNLTKIDTLTKTISKEYIQLVSTTLSIPFDILNEQLTKENDMKRLFCYLLTKQDENIVVNNLLTCLLHIVDPRDYLVKE